MFISFVWGVFVRGVFGKGGFCPGGFCPGVYVRGVFVRGVFVLIPKNQPNAVHPMRSMYILADRFLRNRGYIVSHDGLSTLGCQFTSKTSLDKLKNPNVCTEMFSCHKNQPNTMHPLTSLYIN